MGFFTFSAHAMNFLRSTFDMAPEEGEALSDDAGVLLVWGNAHTYWVEICRTTVIPRFCTSVNCFSFSHKKGPWGNILLRVVSPQSFIYICRS